MFSNKTLLPRVIKAMQAASTTIGVSIRCIVATRKDPQGQPALRIGREDWAPALLDIAGATLDVAGTENVDFNKPHVFVMNHQSLLDIPVAFMSLPVNICFIAKKELEWVPFMGRAMRDCGMIFVDRRNPSKARASLRAGADLIRTGINVFAFPEGTRSKDGYIMPFKKGIFVLAREAKVPVVPMAVSGADKVLPPQGFDPQPGHIRVAIGKPVDFGRGASIGIESLIEEVRRRVIELSLSIDGLGSQLQVSSN